MRFEEIYMRACSKSHEDMRKSEETRERLVPRYYFGCGHRYVLAQPWDILTDEDPMYVACNHPEFHKTNSGECLGQCALSGKPYGKPY